MSDRSPELDSAQEALQRHAAEVQDYLVALRGGAPFLSGADGQLLASWLQEGVPVAVILSAVDDVAERRRRKRSRRRLTLAACRAAVEKAWATSADLRHGAPDPGSPALLALAEELAGADLPDQALLPQAALVAELLALAGRSLPLPERAALALAAVGRFHEACWEASDDRHAELRARAEGDLAALRAAVPASTWAELVEEVARDLLRQELAAVSGRRVWDTLAR